MKGPSIILLTSFEGPCFTIGFDDVGLNVGSEYEYSSAERVVRSIHFDTASCLIHQLLEIREGQLE